MSLFIIIYNSHKKPHELKLDTTNKNYIQIIHVQAYFSKEELNERMTFFERNNNLKKFFYETPYQLKNENDETLTDQNLSDKPKTPHSDLLKLCKKKIILESKYTNTVI